MPVGSRPWTSGPITIPFKKPKCNCELCSATVGKPKTDPQPNIKPTNNRNKLPSINEDFDDIPCIPIKPSKKVHDCGATSENPSYPEPESKPGRLQVIAEEDANMPCRKRQTDIIRRNKIAVKILSKQLKVVKSQVKPCCSRYESLQLFPTATHAMRWAPAYSLARRESGFSGCCPKKKIKAPKILDIEIPDKNRYCACELMSNAIRADLAHHLGLSDQRKKINGSTESIPSNRSRKA